MNFLISLLASFSFLKRSKDATSNRPYGAAEQYTSSKGCRQHNPDDLGSTQYVKNVIRSDGKCCFNK